MLLSTHRADKAHYRNDCLTPKTLPNKDSPAMPSELSRLVHCNSIGKT